MFFDDLPSLLLADRATVRLLVALVVFLPAGIAFWLWGWWQGRKSA